MSPKLHAPLSVFERTGETKWKAGKAFLANLINNLCNIFKRADIAVWEILALLWQPIILYDMI